MYSTILVFFALLALPSIARAGPPVTLISNSQLDPSGIYFVSYDGLVNVDSFQLSGVLTYSDWQYASWYTSSKYAIVARRSLPSGTWETLQLPHQLSVSDSHNVISLGISPADGKIHVAMDCHSTRLYYTSSEAGLATSGESWTADRFGSVINSLGNLAIGSTITYPQFVITPENLLQFVYRSGISGDGGTQLAEYRSGSWYNIGSWASSSGTYTAPSGAKSLARNLYIHGFTYGSSRAHVTGTWREQSGSVTCNSGGLTNHDTIYLYSEDEGECQTTPREASAPVILGRRRLIPFKIGRTWKNSAGLTVGTSGSKPVSVSAAGIIIDSLDADHGLMNQESQAVDSSGLIHAIISYVPGRFTQCVTNYVEDRISYGRPFHLYKTSNGTFVKMEIPVPLNSVGRSQIVMDNSDNVYVVLPYVRIVSASRSSSWTDWTVVYDGVADGLNAFGEVTVDRARVSTGVLSVLYQQKSSGTTPSPVQLIDFRLNA